MRDQLDDYGRPKIIGRYIACASVLILNGGLWVLASALIAFVSEQPDMLFLAVMSLSAAIQVAGGIGALLGVRRRRGYAIPMGLAGALSLLGFCTATFIIAASKGHLENIQPQNMIPLLIALACAVYLCVASFSTTLRQFLSSSAT